MDHITWKARWTLQKYRDNNAIEPYETIDGVGNMLMSAGASAIWRRLIGTDVTAFDNGNAYIGVGSGTTPASADQEDLQGSSKDRQGMEASYPVHVNGENTITFRAKWGSSDGNFAWNEWGLFNASTGGTMLNRKVTDLGTKESPEEWTFTITLEIE